VILVEFWDLNLVPDDEYISKTQFIHVFHLYFRKKVFQSFNLNIHNDGIESTIMVLSPAGCTRIFMQELVHV